MFLFVQVLCVLLAAISMSLALAHALEYPGKLRLDEKTYRAVQEIYYPGFTFGGLSEWLGILATAGLLWMTPTHSTAYWWTLAGLILFIAMHAIYWIVTHPVNKFWLKDQDLKGVGASFFEFDPLKREEPAEDDANRWKRLRDRWEYSHVARAVLAISGLISLIVAVAI